MNEGSWPSQTKNNPFLSRVMKTEVGLEPPERQIGQVAHDFQMACGTRKLIFSRSLRQGSAPTVASRWLQRLMALGGPVLEDEMRKRGQIYRRYADLIDQGENQAPAQRPAPRPRAELQPRAFSFSEVGRFRRDPYSIYARRILRLDPVDPFNQDPGLPNAGRSITVSSSDSSARIMTRPGWTRSISCTGSPTRSFSRRLCRSTSTSSGGSASTASPRPFSAGSGSGDRRSSAR